MKLHAKEKGAIGTLAVVKYLVEHGHPTFIELSDNSKADIISIIGDGCCPVLIQVKAITSKNGKVEVYVNKSGPSYSYRYSSNDCDVFAIYILDKDIIFFISSEELTRNKGSMSFRIEQTRNRQQCKTHNAYDYISLKKALENYTPRTVIFSGVGS